MTHVGRTKLLAAHDVLTWRAIPGGGATRILWVRPMTCAASAGATHQGPGPAKIGEIEILDGFTTSRRMQVDETKLAYFWPCGYPQI